MIVIFVCNVYSSCHADGDLIFLSLSYLTPKRNLGDGDSWFSSLYCCSDIFVDTSIVAATNAANVAAANATAFPCLS